MNLIFSLYITSAYKYLGYRLGKNYRRLPKSLVLKWTMNKEYWRHESLLQERGTIDPKKGYGRSEEEAKRKEEEIKKIEPKFRYLDMGIYFTQNGNGELAEKYLKKSQQTEKDPYADYVLGIVYFNQNKIEDARKMFQSAANKGVEDAKAALEQLNSTNPAPATTPKTPTKPKK